MPFRKRPAYRYAVKHSIYVHPDHLHSGLGRLLLPALIEACTAEGFRQMIAYVDADNLPSQNLHEAFGFRRVGLLEGVGYDHAADGGIGLHRHLGILDAPRPDHLEAEPLDGDGDLVEPVAFEDLGVERRRAEQEGEAPEEVHQ